MMQSTERECPECTTDEQTVYYRKDKWLLVCPQCYWCPERVSRTPTTDPWQQFWDQRQERDGRTRCVGGYSHAY